MNQGELSQDQLSTLLPAAAAAAHAVPVPALAQSHARDGETKS